MYTNKGLSIICKRLSKSWSTDPIKEEMSKLLCPYAGIQEALVEPHIKDILVDASKLFQEESIRTGQSLLTLFGQWLGNEEFRHKCLSDINLIIGGSGILEVYPHTCVEVPALQLIYDNVNWFPSDIPDDVINLSRDIATKKVSKRLESIFNKS